MTLWQMLTSVAYLLIYPWHWFWWLLVLDYFTWTEEVHRKSKRTQLYFKLLRICHSFNLSRGWFHRWDLRRIVMHLEPSSWQPFDWFLGNTGRTSFVPLFLGCLRHPRCLRLVDCWHHGQSHCCYCLQNSTRTCCIHQTSVWPSKKKYLLVDISAFNTMYDDWTKMVGSH